MIWCRGCLMASDARGLIGRALFEHRTLPGTRWDSEDTAAVREGALYDADIALRAMDFEKLVRERDQARADWDQAIVAWREAQRERDEARRMYEDAREQFDITARERDEARAEAARYREALERLTKAVHNWNVALEIDDAGEIYAVNCELEAAVIAADERLGGGGQ